MPTTAEVLDQLTDILVRVVSCPVEAVQNEANLKTDLGVDSLTIVEVGEELGRRFNVYLSDDTIDEMVTVKDAVNAVVRHDGSSASSMVTPPQVPSQPKLPSTPPKPKSSDPRRQGRIARAAIGRGVVGAAIGILFGLAGSAFVGATGIGAVNLPPLTIATTTAPTATATPTPTPTATSGTAEPEPNLSVSSERVAPGERFRLEGAFPALGKGATLQVQVKDEGADWDDFPVDTKTDEGGKYRTEIYTSRTGLRQFRMLHKESDKATPGVTVEIG